MPEAPSDFRDVLSTIPLFQGLNSNDLDWVARRSHQRPFSAGTSVLIADQPGEAVYIILEGSVKIFIDQTDKKAVVLSIIGAGDMLGEISLLDSEGHSASAVTLEDSHMLWMDKASFLQMLDDIPRVCRNMVNIMGARLRMNNELIQSLATLDANGRVARQLLTFVNRYDSHGDQGPVLIPMTLTQGDIADLVGASRRHVNQVMSSFRDQGLISVDKSGKITVLDRAGLFKYCR
jgi:CRP/FNR family cyclic AMP-dependent transcriptional regulator